MDSPGNRSGGSFNNDNLYENNSIENYNGDMNSNDGNGEYDNNSLDNENIDGGFEHFEENELHHLEHNFDQDQNSKNQNNFDIYDDNNNENDDMLKLEMDLMKASGNKGIDMEGIPGDCMEIKMFIGIDEDDENEKNIDLNMLF